MGLGIYILLNGLAYLLILLIKPRTRLQDKFWLYTGWSVTVSLLCLALFGALSISIGILQIGSFQDFNLPQDYISLGATGWGVLLIGLIGILAPVGVFLVLEKSIFTDLIDKSS